MRMDSYQMRVMMGGKRQTPHMNNDVRRRVYTPTLTIPRPLIRRPSLDSAAPLRNRQVLGKHDISVKTDPLPQLFRAHSFRDVIVRDSVPRKQTTVPSATKLTHEQEIKPILKVGKGTYVLPTQESSGQSSPKQSPRIDGRFCYKLPDRPAVKIRKTVSFKEDLLGSRRHMHRMYSSPPPVFSTCVGRDSDRQVFV